MPACTPRTIGWLTLAACVGLAGCTPRALTTSTTLPSTARGEVRLVLGAEARATQWAAPAARARLSVDGPGMSAPVVLTADLSSEATASLVVSNLPAGPNRIVTLDRLDAQGAPVPGGTLKTTVDIVAGTSARADLGKVTTPRGMVFERVLAGDRAQDRHLAETLNEAALQGLVEAVIRQGAVYPELVNAEAIAADIQLAGRVPSFETRYVRYPATLDVTLEGIPGPAPADVWLDDPLSPKNVTLHNGTHRVTPVAPGTWVLHARSLGMGVEATRSLTLTSNQTATVSVNLGAPPDQVQGAMPVAGMAGACGLLTVGGEDLLIQAGGLRRATDSLYFHNQVWAYDGASWSQKAGLPAVLGYAQGASLGGSFYVAGGIRPGVFGLALARDVYRFDGGAWSTLPSLPVPRGGASVAALGGHLYLVGGFRDASWGPYGSYPESNTAYDRDFSAEFNATESFRYDPTANTWATLPTGLNVARGDMATVVQAGRIYAFGGQEFSDFAGSYVQFPSNAVESADANGQWRLEPAMPTARGGAAAVAANGKIYVIGGCTIGGIPLNSVEVFDPVTGRWAIKPPLRRARGYVTAGLVNGRIVVAGGGDGGSAGLEGAPQDTVESFVP